jgi:hypothetical protein
MCQSTVRATWGAVLSRPARPRSASLATVWGASMRVPSAAKASQRPRVQYVPAHSRIWRRNRRFSASTGAGDCRTSASVKPE